MEKIRILVVEDDSLTRKGLIHLLKENRVFPFTFSEAESKTEAIQLLERGSYDLAFIDLDLRDQELAGLEIAKLAKSKNTYTVILTAHNEQSIIKKAYEEGAIDYLVKPFKESSLNYILEQYLKYSRSSIIKDFISGQYITSDSQTIDSLKGIENTYLNDSSVLVLGPTGSGKDVVAKTIHKAKHENLEKFEVINCGALKNNTLSFEDVLFGHEKGSFTGAGTKREGLVEKANGGTLFLDEIADLDPSAQDALITFLEDKCYRKLGSDQRLSANVKIVMATCKNLLELVKKSEFRDDLYHRLITGQLINLKSLKERKSDIPLLISHFIDNHRSGRKIIVDENAMKTLEMYSWPGNVRELKGIVSKWFINGKTIVYEKDLPQNVRENFESSDFNESFITNNQLKTLKKNGWREFADQILISAIVPSFINNGRKMGKTLKDINITKEVFYRIKSRLESEGNYVLGK